MGIVRLRVRNYRGIEALDAPIGKEGAIARGANGRGKTSVLRSVRAALAARDIGPDAIRGDAERAEILVDMDDVTVKRTITRKGGSTLQIDTAAGDRKAKPQTWLNELLGTAPLDPLDFFLADAKKRRALVLDALPVKLTRELVEQYVPAWAREALAPRMIDNLLDLNGLEASGELHREFYKQRAEANAGLKAARAHVEEIDVQVAKMLARLPPSTLTMESALARAQEARMLVSELRSTAKRAHEQETKFASTRQRIQELLAEAQRTREAAPKLPPKNVLDAAYTKVDQAAARVLELEAELAAARSAADRVKTELDDLRAAAALHEKADARSKSCESQAKDLEETLQQASIDAPSADVIAQAEGMQRAADDAIEGARQAAVLDGLKRELATAQGDVDQLTKRADDLSQIVEGLSKQLPAELIAKSDGIKGLGIDGDTITLDGVSVDALSGREQMRFAVEIARRANAKARILVVDGLERLDPEQLDVFIADATRDGWQLIATRVDRGDMVLEAIVTEKSEAAE